MYVYCLYISLGNLSISQAAMQWELLTFLEHLSSGFVLFNL